VASPAPGPAGNVEYFLWLSTVRPADQQAAEPEPEQNVDAMLERAVQEGPQ
jgi:23S rRNA (cytidine1920-2'-O)/16S rRNA (cytidine1409-2'-O)-methyltransferase